MHRQDFQTVKPWQRPTIAALAYYAKAPQAIFTHESAALFWSLPVLDTPSAVHIHAPAASRGKILGVKKHFAPLNSEYSMTPCGAQATTICRTIADCARTLPTRDAVVLADGALRQHLVTHVELSTYLKQLSGPGSVKAQRVAELMSYLADSPGETLVRLHLEAMGMRYQEQVQFSTSRGSYRVDFYLPDFGVVIEFDGDIKYRDYGPTDAVLLEERKREKALTNQGLRIYRTSMHEVCGDGAAFRQGLARFLG